MHPVPPVHPPTPAAARRLELSRGDWRAVKAGLDKARGLCTKGGDWERKNKLKVYEAVFLAATRQFKRAAELLLDAIATFTRLVGGRVWWCVMVCGVCSGWGHGQALCVCLCVFAAAMAWLAAR